MNERGNVILFIILGFVAILVLPPIIMIVWPPAKLLFQILSIFMIYTVVRGYLGSGPITLVVSAVLIWFLVFKYTYIFASLWTFQILLGVSFMSLMVWGIGMNLRPRG